jgi:hypothetical protein
MNIDIKIDTFEELLELGHYNLSTFPNLDDTNNITGIEDSLVEPYLSQMKLINKFIYTVASTNYPNALPFFQPFFVEGVCRLSDARKLCKKLTHEYIWVVYQDPITGKYYDRSNEVTLWEMAHVGSPLDSSSRMYLLSECLNEKVNFLGCEVLKYTDHKLFRDNDDPLVGIIIEDSCPSRKDLYEKIFNFF